VREQIKLSSFINTLNTQDLLLDLLMSLSFLICLLFKCFSSLWLASSSLELLRYLFLCFSPDSLLFSCSGAAVLTSYFLGASCFFCSSFCFLSSPQLAITTFYLGLSLESVGSFSTFSQISYPFSTLPKTTCLPLSHEAGANVKKNWEPLVLRPEFAEDSRPLVLCWSLKFSSANLDP